MSSPTFIRFQLGALLTEYGIHDADQRETLLAMARSGKQRGWWPQYGDLPQAYRHHIGLESAAVEILNFETIVVPGLLQTADYARTITVGAAIGHAPEAAEQRVTVRLERQKLITAGALRFVAVIDDQSL